MARIRTIKPDFFTSQDVAVLPLRARLTWVGLWTHADDHGRAKDVAALIRAAIWPLDDVTVDEVEDDLRTLAEHGRIVRYRVEGRSYLAVMGWHVHQAVNRPRDSVLPVPPVATGPTNPQVSGYCKACHVDVTDDAVNTHDGAVNPHGAFTAGREGKGREGKGGARDASLREPAVTTHAPPGPPLRCPRHTHDPDPPPCGPCGDARRARDAWQAGQRARPTPTPGRPECPLHPGQPSGSEDCPRCVAEAAPPPDLRAALRRPSTDQPEHPDREAS